MYLDTLAWHFQKIRARSLWNIASSCCNFGGSTPGYIVRYVGHIGGYAWGQANEGRDDFNETYCQLATTNWREFARTNGSEFLLRVACTNRPEVSRPRSLAYRHIRAAPAGRPGPKVPWDWPVETGRHPGQDLPLQTGRCLGRQGGWHIGANLAGRLAPWEGGGGGCLDKQTGVWPATKVGISAPIQPGGLAPRSRGICL